MDRDALSCPPAAHLGEGYANQDELLEDISTWLDQLLYAYYSRHQWLGPSSELKNMLGLVVSREEFEHNLAKAGQRGLERQLSREEQEQLALVVRAIRLRLEKTRVPLPLPALFQRFGLSLFQCRCVLLAYIATVQQKYEKLFAYLQDDITLKAPGIHLALQLFLPRDGTLSEYAAQFFHPSPFLSLFDPGRLQQGQLVLQEPVVQFLTSGQIPDRPGRTFFDGASQRPVHALVVQETWARQLDGAFAGEGPCCVLLSGRAGSGKRFQVEHLMARHQARCVFADLEGEDWREQAEQAALEANLTGACLCLYHLDRQSESGDPAAPGGEMMEFLSGLEVFAPVRFFLSRLPAHASRQMLSVELSLPELTQKERLALFQWELREVALGDITPEELSAKFRFTPRQIHMACRQAVGLARLSGEGTVGARLLHQCCYAQVVHRLGDLASQVPAAFTWDDVVLPRAQKQLMRRACGHIKYQHQVYGAWGFDKKVSYGRGLSILFAGAPGTGKTMCAQVIANQLNMEMYKINLSQIVSKYIGETEKNLHAVFSEAKNANCILFFDECDALFGKRSEVKDAHDRNANVEVAYLLQQIEEYDGVCILATNLIGNIDEAFMRRITYVVRFPFPEAPMRQEIYRRMVPPGAPVSDDVDWAFLGEKFQLSGGHIKNIVLAAAFLAAGEDSPITMRHLLLSAVNEMKKNDIVVVREQLQEYADLLEDGGEGVVDT